MLTRTVSATSILLVGAALAGGCAEGAAGLSGLAAGDGAGAAIIGTVSTGSASGKALTWSNSSTCPEMVVTLNGSPADVKFDDDCSFAIDEIAPADLVELRVEIASLGISGTVELASVTDAELIELQVEVGADSLSVAVARRDKPVPGDELPAVIDENNVSIVLPAGTFDQDLTVNKNNFTLTGAAGADCDADGWTVITGDVTVNGNNATFRNVKFAGTVAVYGNNTRFVQCCFDGVLVSFGHGNGNPDKSGDDGDDHGDDDADDDGDNEDDDKDDDRGGSDD